MVPRALSVSLCSLRLPGVTASPDPRVLLERLAGSGIRAVQLDATMPGLRPRELDQSARRDLTGFLRRRGLAMTGIDLFIPPGHFLDAATQDRAVDALVSALGLAQAVGEGASRQVCTRLPSGFPSAMENAILATAIRDGVTVVDHRWPIPDATTAPRHGGLRVGLDSTELSASGASWAHAVQVAGDRLASARLRAGTIAAASPRDQDLRDMLIALAGAGYDGPLVVDARGAPEPWRAATDTLARMEGLAP